MYSFFNNSFFVQKRRSIVAIILLLVSLQACSTYSPSTAMIGMSVSDVVEAMGKPDGNIQLPEGTRLEFSRGPRGKHTYFVNFDLQGRLTSWQQVLTEDRFKQILPGMSEEEVVFLIGTDLLPNLVRSRPRVCG